mgnify:CR=1 FL=1
MKSPGDARSLHGGHKSVATHWDAPCRSDDGSKRVSPFPLDRVNYCIPFPHTQARKLRDLEQDRAPSILPSASGRRAQEGAESLLDDRVVAGNALDHDRIVWVELVIGRDQLANG